MTNAADQHEDEKPSDWGLTEQQIWEQEHPAAAELARVKQQRDVLLAACREAVQRIVAFRKSARLEDVTVEQFLSDVQRLLREPLLRLAPEHQPEHREEPR